jgi:hypothetical protein
VLRAVEDAVGVGAPDAREQTLGTRAMRLRVRRRPRARTAEAEAEATEADKREDESESEDEDDPDAATVAEWLRAEAAEASDAGGVDAALLRGLGEDSADGARLAAATEAAQRAFAARTPGARDLVGRARAAAARQAAADSDSSDFGSDVDPALAQLLAHPPGTDDSDAEPPAPSAVRARAGPRRSARA